MLTRSKVTLAVGATCAAGAVLAGGAAAHGGGHHASRAALHLEVRGLVTAVTAATETAPASITVSPGGTLAPWTCALRPRIDTTGIVANTTTVKMSCRLKRGVLTAKRVRTTEKTEGRVAVLGRGLVSAFTAPVAAATPDPPATPAEPATPETPGTSKLFEKSGSDPATPADPAAPGGATTTPGSITIDTGDGVQSVTCAITGRTRLRGTPVAGTSTAWFACRAADDALVAKRILVKRDRSEIRSERRRGDDGNRKGR